MLLFLRKALVVFFKYEGEPKKGVFHTRFGSSRCFRYLSYHLKEERERGVCLFSSVAEVTNTHSLIEGLGGSIYLLVAVRVRATNLWTHVSHHREEKEKKDDEEMNEKREQGKKKEETMKPRTISTNNKTDDDGIVKKTLLFTTTTTTTTKAKSTFADAEEEEEEEKEEILHQTSFGVETTTKREERKGGERTTTTRQRRRRKRLSSEEKKRPNAEEFTTKMTPEITTPQQRIQHPALTTGAVSRPANNQLLYRAKFDWSHYPLNALDEHFLRTKLHRETVECASVSSAFLQIMSAIQTAEKNRKDGRRRNALKLLSKNTRKTKVVALSSSSCSSGGDGSVHKSNNKKKKGGSNKGEAAGGRAELTTHRVLPEDLKKHDGLYESEDGVEYGTNLDRNRYGTDTDYLHTCIKYNVASLNLCEKLVNIEIVDSKGSITAAATSDASGGSSRRKKFTTSAPASSPPSKCVRIVREGECECRCEEINKEIQSMMERKEIFDSTKELVWPQVGKKHGNLGNRNRTKNKSSNDNNNDNNATGATSVQTTTTNTTTTTTTTNVMTTGAMAAIATPRMRASSEDQNEKRGESGKTNNDKLGVLLDALTQVGGIQITPNGTPSRPTRERKITKMDDVIFAEYESQRAASPVAIQPAKDKAFGGTLPLAIEQAFASTPPRHKTTTDMASKGVDAGVATTNNIENVQNTEAIREAIIAATKESIDMISEENLRDELRNAVVCAYERHIHATVAENNRRYAEINVNLLSKEILSLREELRSMAMTNASLRLKRAADETAKAGVKTKIRKQKESATNASSLEVEQQGESSEEEVTTPRKGDDANNNNVLVARSSLQDDIAQVKRRLERALENDAEPVATKALFFQEVQDHLTTLLRFIHCEVLLNASSEGRE